MPTGTKTYPYVSFRFHVEIDDIRVALVSEVSGLQIETETEPYEEGGVNDFVHQLPKRTKYQHITLKRGITEDDVLWNWYQEVVNGMFERKKVSIALLDISDNDITKMTWNLSQAYPVKWTGPDFKADSGAVAFESIEFVHHGILKV